MIYRLRVILDTQEDVFRDLEIERTASLEDLHNTIIHSFGFSGDEMASFYTSDDEWNQDEEIVLFGMNDGTRTMSDTTLDEVLGQEQTKLIYVYDFLEMWTFLIELAEIAEPSLGVSYPNLMFAHGQLPESAPEKEFVAEEFFTEDDSIDDYEEEDYDDYDFDENWN